MGKTVAVAKAPVPKTQRSISKQIAATAEAALMDDSRRQLLKLVLQQMKMLGAPTILMGLVILVMSHPDLPGYEQNVDWVEYFAGQKAVSRSMLSANLVTLSFELLDNAVTQNLMHEAGMIYALYIALRVKDGGGSNTAPVCSTWVWVNRATSQRSVYRPLGSSSVPSVRLANTVVTRTMLLCWLFTSRKVFWVLEQPCNSLMEKHPRFAELAARIRVYRTTINMQDFGACSKKPTWIYSAHSFISELAAYAGRYGVQSGPAKAKLPSITNHTGPLVQGFT